LYFLLVFHYIFIKSEKLKFKTDIKEAINNFIKVFLINSKEETFSGFSFTLSCTEMGISWLDVEMNSKLEIGDVNWEFKE